MGGMGGMIPYSEAATYAESYPGYSGNYAGGMGQYGQYGYGQSTDTSNLWSAPLQDSMFIESIGRTIAWDCTAYFNNPPYPGSADGTIKGTVSSYTSNVAPIEEDIVITCNFANFAWYQNTGGIRYFWNMDK